MSSKKLLIILAALLAVGAGLFAIRGKIAMAVMERVVARSMAEDPLSNLPDGLHVALCGAGSPIADPKRAGPCVAVIAGQRLFIVDIGDGATRNLSLMNLPPARVEAAFLTHFHSDHIDGLGGLMLQHWGGSAQKPLPIHGPQGVEQVVAGFQQAYSLDSGYRIAHHGPKIMPPSGFGGQALPFTIDAAHPEVLIINDPDLKVRAFSVDHSPVEPAVGYIFEYKGRKVVLSGDTKPSPHLEAVANKADLLVHEALSPELVKMVHDAAQKAGRTGLTAILNDIPGYHTSPEQAAAIAERAGVKMLLLNHIVPPLRLKALEGPFLGKSRQIYHGRLQVGIDGDVVSLPANSDRIETSNRLK